MCGLYGLSTVSDATKSNVNRVSYMTISKAVSVVGDWDCQNVVEILNASRVSYMTLSGVVSVVVDWDREKDVEVVNEIKSVLYHTFGGCKWYYCEKDVKVVNEIKSVLYHTFDNCIW